MKLFFRNDKDLCKLNPEIKTTVIIQNPNNKKFKLIYNKNV